MNQPANRKGFIERTLRALRLKPDDDDDDERDLQSIQSKVTDIELRQEQIHRMLELPIRRIQK